LPPPPLGQQPGGSVLCQCKNVFNLSFPFSFPSLYPLFISLFLCSSGLFWSRRASWYQRNQRFTGKSHTCCCCSLAVDWCSAVGTASLSALRKDHKEFRYTSLFVFCACCIVCVCVCVCVDMSHEPLLLLSHWKNYGG